MRERLALNLYEHLSEPAKKKLFNEKMFSLIAPEYNFITGALSFWRDAGWKRAMMSLLPRSEKPLCLDLACGTGQLTSLLARKYPRGVVVGADLADRMLAIAKRDCALPNIRYVRLNMCELGFKDGSIDVLTGGYALRNAPDLDAALKEIGRVLKPGGVAAFLDFSKPPRGFPQAVRSCIIKTWGAFWGLILHGNPQVYTYIAESLRRFPDRLSLRRMLASNGMVVLESTLFFFGMVELLTVRRACG